MFGIRLTVKSVPKSLPGCLLTPACTATGSPSPLGYLSIMFGIRLTRAHNSGSQPKNQGSVKSFICARITHMSSFDMPTLSRENDKSKQMVPRHEVIVDYARSSGPGGQKVNKTESKAVLRWHVESSSEFTDDEKKRIQEKLAGRINSEGYLIVDNQQTRSQNQNVKLAFARMDELVTEALFIEKERIGTKPTRGAKERRLDNKSKRGALKAQRGNRDWE
ncbi:aminoacyl-tRNA hydrolase [Candidatus Uhrbacteria bacterium]|nr:aminoacyl-tRNA hydrolase [Candidatus Uhrbacteria bacterium]